MYNQLYCLIKNSKIEFLERSQFSGARLNNIYRPFFGTYMALEQVGGASGTTPRLVKEAGHQRDHAPSSQVGGASEVYAPSSQGGGASETTPRLVREAEHQGTTPRLVREAGHQRTTPCLVTLSTSKGYCMRTYSNRDSGGNVNNLELGNVNNLKSLQTKRR